MLRATLVVELEQPAEALAGADSPRRLAHLVRRHRKQHPIPFPLVVSPGVEMLRNPTSARVTFRAICSIQWESGEAVIPAMYTFLDATRMKVST